jgi:hypothetical protein
MISPQFAPFFAPNTPSIVVAPSIPIVPYIAITSPSCLPRRRVAVTPSITVALALSIAVVNVASSSHLQ